MKADLVAILLSKAFLWIVTWGGQGVGGGILASLAPISLETGMVHWDLPLTTRGVTARL